VLVTEWGQLLPAERLVVVLGLIVAGVAVFFATLFALALLLGVWVLGTGVLS
jgi:hypothetical protein